ncbi:hypothetical protein [Actinophytocola sp.]|uniref:hypothetical protein n=1 Tax=Actinophytocola sp. TaxID=1872138 RepID=UPI002ED0F8E5
MLTDQEAADTAVNTAAAFPQLVADHGLDQDAITELLAGERDVFVAAWANQLASPFGPAGKTVSSPTLGLSTVSARGVPAPAPAQPGPAAGVLLPPVPPATHRGVGQWATPTDALEARLFAENRLPRWSGS